MDVNEPGSDATSGALELHRMFVSNLKRATNELLKQKAIPAAKAHIALGLKPLAIAVAPMLEAAFGYRGSLRFVAFHFSPARAVPVHSDGGDDLPIPNANDWITFVSHPAVCPVLEEYSSLFGRLGKRRVLTAEEFQELEDQERLGYCSRFHALVLDRQERILYIANWQSLKMFQPYSEPDDREAHIELATGTLISPGNEEYSRPPAPAIVEELFAWLDNQVLEPDAQEHLARWHIHHGRPDEGARILKSILDRDPSRTAHPGLLYDLSSLFGKQHDHQAALDALESCSHTARLGSRGHFTLAQLYIEVGRFNDALAQLEIADSSYEPKDGQWYALKARALAGLGEFERAAKICADVLTNAPTDEVSLEAADIHLELAAIAAFRRDYGVAAQECCAALDYGYFDPESEMEDSIAVYRPAWWLSTEARLVNAARRFEEAASDKSSEKSYVASGYLYLGMSRYKDAEESFSNAAALNSSPEILWLYGISSLATKKRDRAESIFRQFIERFPQDERGWVGLGLCHAAAGWIGEAFTYCNKASCINEHGGEMHALRAFLKWSTGRYLEAEEEVHSAANAGFTVHPIFSQTCDDEHSKSIRYLSSTAEEDHLRKLVSGAHLPRA